MPELDRARFGHNSSTAFFVDVRIHAAVIVAGLLSQCGASNG